MDISKFVGGVAEPGDARFDIIEVLSKLQEKYEPNQLIDQLKRHGVDFSKPFEHTSENAALMREIARNEGVLLDGRLKGFAYNLGGVILYTSIREDMLQELAATYNVKEKEERMFGTIEEAKEYISALAEKYFYHELGHSVYRKIFTTIGRQQWSRAVGMNSDLINEIYDLQREKYPGSDAAALGPVLFDEAFAEIFSTVATSGKVNGRVSAYPNEEELLRDLLIKHGFRFEERPKDL